MILKSFTPVCPSMIYLTFEKDSEVSRMLFSLVSVSLLQALSYLDEDFMYQLEGIYLDKANEVKLPVHLNMAACQLQIGDYHTAIYNCSEVKYF
jgi:hypothetical protein